MMKRLNSESKFVLAFLLVTVVVVGAVFIANAFHKTPEPVPVPPEPAEIEELFVDRNVDETLIKVLIKDGDNPAFRSAPRTADDTKLGTLTSGQKFYVEAAYTAEDKEGKIWLGIKYNEFRPRKVEYKLEQTIIDDDDRIVWVRGDYATAMLVDHNPGEYDKQDAQYYTRYDSGEYRIVVSGCALRSTPDTSDSRNIYGKFKTTSYIHTDIIYENTVNTFYGVPAKAIDNKYLEERVGNVESDPDGIVWLSVEYVDSITTK